MIALNASNESDHYFHHGAFLLKIIDRKKAKCSINILLNLGVDRNYCDFVESNFYSLRFSHTRVNGYKAVDCGGNYWEYNYVALRMSRLVAENSVPRDFDHLEAI